MRNSKKSVQKKAAADAHEYAAAYMAVGEGAGNRRKHIEGSVEYQMEFVPGYREAFEKEHATQDMAKHADQARKENVRRQRVEATERNAKAVMSGDMRNADLKVIALLAGAAFAHKQGYDVKAWNFVKGEAATLKATVKKKFAGKKPGPQAAKANADGSFDITEAR